MGPQNRHPNIEHSISHNEKISMSQSIGKWLPSMNTVQLMNSSFRMQNINLGEVPLKRLESIDTTIGLVKLRDSIRSEEMN